MGIEAPRNTYEDPTYNTQSRHTIMRPTQLLRSGGGKIPYPKHVWSPAGGWYAQPANWKQNTAVMGAVVVGICLMVGSVSADREHRDKMPDVRPLSLFCSLPLTRTHERIRTHTQGTNTPSSGYSSTLLCAPAAG